ncbi:hypothetical protein ONZ45_g8431 [Pleurotus djamor]|nr:hypothetical protein ONZ45_g8431 [Pleurotus djamor]
MTSSTPTTFECSWLYVFYTPDRYFYAFPREDHSQFPADISGDALFDEIMSVPLRTARAMDVSCWKLEPPLPLESRRKLRVDGFFNDIAIPGARPLTQLTYTRHGISMHYIREPPLLGRDAFSPTANSLHFIVVAPEPVQADPLQHVPADANRVRLYESTFIKVTRLEGNFLFDYLELNGLVSVTDTTSPDFVESFESVMSSEDILSPLTLEHLENSSFTSFRRNNVVNIAIPEPDRQAPQPTTSPTSNTQDNRSSSRRSRSEDSMQDDEGLPSSQDILRTSLLDHLNYLRRDFRRFWCDTSMPDGRLKEMLGNSMFFHGLTISVAPGSQVKPKLNQPWPFRLIIAMHPSPTYPQLRSFQPRSDFALLRDNLPRLIVEINSTGGKVNPTFPPDYIRMLLCGASLVRFANQHLDAYRARKTFVLVAIFMHNEGTVDWHTMFQVHDEQEQESEDSSQVRYHKHKINLNTFQGRAEFALRLYNFLQSLDDNHSQADSTIGDALGSFVEATKLLKAYTQPKTSKQTSNKRARTEGSSGPNQGGTLQTVTEDDSACTELRSHGFEVHASLGNSFPHMAVVWRAPNPNIRFVAKKVPKNSREVDILRRLNSIPDRSENIVELVDSFYGTSGTLWAVFPKLPQSLDDCLHYYPPDYLSPHASSICESLVQVISHLHALNIAHQDIKPDNILLTDDFALKLIDFGFAIEVRDENDQVRDLTGTKGWNPPEIEEGWPKHSPIKADRWACGNVVLYILDTCKIDGPHGLRSFATQLTSKSPEDRPPVSRWFDAME